MAFCARFALVDLYAQGMPATMFGRRIHALPVPGVADTREELGTQRISVGGRSAGYCKIAAAWDAAVARLAGQRCLGFPM